jgi:hypothetical protein
MHHPTRLSDHRPTAADCDPLGRCWWWQGKVSEHGESYRTSAWDLSWPSSTAGDAETAVWLPFDAMPDPGMLQLVQNKVSTNVEIGLTTEN